MAGMAKTKRADMFVAREDDPRDGGPTMADERTTLVEYLRYQRLTLDLKCAGLEPADLARRSVEPSTLSLLGLVRHMAEVERVWFRRRLAGQDVPKLYQSQEEPDGDFDGAVADATVVTQAFQDWRDEMAFSDRFIAEAPHLEVFCYDRDGNQVSLREVLVHMVEEYARHNGHADLLRERIDGRVGQ
jgi:uncharacterized damage-inducible protein DinB